MRWGHDKDQTPHFGFWQRFHVQRPIIKTSCHPIYDSPEMKAAEKRLKRILDTIEDASKRGNW